MLQKSHTNKHYATMVLKKNWNIKTKVVRKKDRMKKRRREKER